MSRLLVSLSASAGPKVCLGQALNVDALGADFSIGHVVAISEDKGPGTTLVTFELDDEHAELQP